MKLEPDVSVAQWIRPRLERSERCIGAVIPCGFEAYARLLHPIERQSPPAHLRWADVAHHTGGQLHSLAQFWCLAGRASPSAAEDAAWVDGRPATGELAIVEQAKLIAQLAAHTADGTCVAAVWAGWGHLRQTTGFGPGATRLPNATSSAVFRQIAQTPRWLLPHREYVLFRGHLSEVTELGVPGPLGFCHLTPALLWPCDHSWCVASEVDLDSTLIGGTRALIDAILADSELESFAVHTHESLAWDGDSVNARVR